MLLWNLRPWKLEQCTPKEHTLSARESITATQCKFFFWFLSTGGLVQIDCFALYLFVCHQLVAIASLGEFTFGLRIWGYAIDLMPKQRQCGRSDYVKDDNDLERAINKNNNKHRHFPLIMAWVSANGISSLRLRSNPIAGSLWQEVIVAVVLTRRMHPSGECSKVTQHHRSPESMPWDLSTYFTGRGVWPLPQAPAKTPEYKKRIYTFITQKQQTLSRRSINFVWTGVAYL